MAPNKLRFEGKGNHKTKQIKPKGKAAYKMGEHTCKRRYRFILKNITNSDVQWK